MSSTEGSNATISIENMKQLVSSITKAVMEKCPGRGRVYGTQVHTVVGMMVKEPSIPGVKVEISYINGDVVRYGQVGSVRIDLVYYDAYPSVPLYAIDIKTGTAMLTLNRIHRLQTEIKVKIPVIQVP